MRKLVKGNEAVVLGAVAAGCDAFFGYPITPASEIAEMTADIFPKLGKIFIQAECELASVSMLFGAAAAGLRSMTSSSGPGISLMQEGISYFSGSQLPAVFVDIMRVGPGIGNIGPEQSDYFQVVKGGGHGTYNVIVLVPNSAAEMYQMTIDAFELADLYRMPVFVLADATLGQMMEPIDLIAPKATRIVKPWKLDTTAITNDNLITSIYMDNEEMEGHITKLLRKFERIEAEEARAQTYQIQGATLIVTGYGIVSRILASVVDELRAEGIAIGMIRPQTVWPFPKQVYQRVFQNLGKSVPVLVVELSTGQFVEDVRLAIPDADIHFYGRWGGNLPGKEELIEKIRSLL